MRSRKLQPAASIAFSTIDLFAACPNDFDYLPEINQCLSFNRKTANWSVARVTCSKFKRRAQLLTIQDPMKQAVVERYVANHLTSKQFELVSNLSGCIPFNFLMFQRFFIDYIVH